MNTPSNQLNPGPLHDCIDAVLAQPAGKARTDQAQRNLIARIDTERAPAQASLPWGWATAALAAVLVPLLMWLPGSNGSLAFAEVQRHFVAFETLTARLTTTMNEQNIVEMTIRVDDQDRARLDTGGGFSYVIDPNQSMMMQLFHDQKRAMMVPLARPDIFNDDTGLDWLADIRAFQGEAEPVDETRLINGTRAQGFKLTAGGMNMTLWAAESGEPLTLRMDGPGGIETRMDFEFDQPMDEALFSLTPPADYRELGPSDAD